MSKYYMGEPLKDFMYEANNGKDIFFAPTKEEAIDVIKTIKKGVLQNYFK